MGVLLNNCLYVLSGIVESSAPVSTSKSMSQPLTLSFVISFLYRLLEPSLWISTPVASSSLAGLPCQLLQGAFYPSCLYFHSFCPFGCPCTPLQYVHLTAITAFLVPMETVI